MFTIPVIEETCDYCLRAFSRRASVSAICPSCGLENVRPASASESAMVAPVMEKAVRKTPAPRRRRKSA